MQPMDAQRSPAQAGFSLVEMLVAVAIGLVLTLILTSVISRQEGARRTLTSGNDVTSNGAYVSYILDREIRSAGTGFSQGWTNTVGCTLRAARDGATILPSSTAFPAPFGSVPKAAILAPVLIHSAAGTGGSDVLAVASGASGLGETVLSVLPGSASAGQIRLANTVGLRGADIILLAEATKGCMLQQVASPFTGGASQQLNFGGTYAKDVIDGVSLSSFSAANNAYAAVMGNATGNQPRLQLFGLGANNTLVSYDLLKLNNLEAAQPIVEGVVDVRALYGIADATGNLTSWVAPTGTTYGITALSDGSTGAQQTLRSIVAVRVGLVLRGDLVERDAVPQSALNLFADLPGGLTYTYAVPGGQERQRFRTVEFTVPLRNVLMTY
jgi:type IV pilus assembly protein PilW